jgi:hypothetical protein
MTPTTPERGGDEKGPVEVVAHAPRRLWRSDHELSWPPLRRLRLRGRDFAGGACPAAGLQALVLADDLHRDGAATVRAGSTVLDENDDGDLGRMRGREAREPGVVLREKPGESSRRPPSLPRSPSGPSRSFRRRRALGRAPGTRCPSGRSRRRRARPRHAAGCRARLRFVADSRREVLHDGAVARLHRAHELGHDTGCRRCPARSTRAPAAAASTVTLPRRWPCSV